MNIAHIPLASLTFELRYAHAFRLWDRAGAIAADAVYRWPALTLREGTPARIRLTLGTRAEINLQLERASVSVSGSKLKLEELAPYCLFLEEALRLIEIKTFTRVGLKASFVKEYANGNIDDAVRDFVATGMSKAITGKHFGIEGKISIPSSVSTCFEGEYLGCTNTLQIRKRTVKLDVPPVIGIEDFMPVTNEHVELVYECDYFTKQDMDVGQLKAARWVDEAIHIIRRDANTILGG
jgi:hypothetical protein